MKTFKSNFVIKDNIIKNNFIQTEIIMNLGQVKIPFGANQFLGIDNY